MFTKHIPFVRNVLGDLPFALLAARPDDGGKRPSFRSLHEEEVEQVEKRLQTKLFDFAPHSVSSDEVKGEMRSTPSRCACALHVSCVV